MLRSQLRPALVSLVALTALTGIAYPAVVTVIGRAVFPEKAGGSLIEQDGRAVGSRLIGQPFDNPKYFWSRPSATADADSKPLPYNGTASSGSNLGPTNPALVDAVKARVEALRAADPANTAPVPVDLVTASGSGLDPQISPAAARYQIGRIARVRKLPPADVERLVERYTEGRTLGVLGEPVVNVLELNLALDGRAAP